MSTVQHPDYHVIFLAGQSNCGKTTLAKKIILNHSFTSKPFLGAIIYRDRFTTPTDYEPIKRRFGHNFKEFTNWGEMERYITTNLAKLERYVLLLDDCDTKALCSDLVRNICKLYAHHRNLSLILTSQVVYSKAKFFGEVTMNTNIFIIFSSPKIASYLVTFSYQMAPYNAKFLVDAFANLKKNYPRDRLYIVCDFRHTTPDELRYFYGLPGDPIRVFFTP